MVEGGHCRAQRKGTIMHRLAYVAVVGLGMVASVYAAGVETKHCRWTVVGYYCPPAS